MARSCVLRRVAAAAARKQCTPWRRSGIAISCPPATWTMASSWTQLSSSRFGFANLVPSMSVSTTSIASSTAVLEDNSGATTTTTTRSGFNPSTATYSSCRRPIKAPVDPCMDLATFVVDGKVDALGERDALIDSSSGERLSYSDLRHAVCAIELGLVSLGVRQGDTVVILSRNSIHYPAVFLATTSVGGILATLNPLCSVEEIKRQVGLTGARHIIVEQELVDKVVDLGVQMVIFEKGNKVKVGSKEVGFQDLLDSDPECQCAPETIINQDDPAAILFSSGTTGASKAVMLSHRNLMSQVLQLEMLEEAVGGEAGVHLCALPMCHVFGMVVIMLQQLYRGGTVVVMPKFELEAAMEAVDKYKVTHFYGVPSIMTGLTKTMTTRSGSFSSVRRIMCGGAPLGKAQVDEVTKLFPDATFLQIYGLTETAGAITLNNLKEDHSPGSVGTLLSNVEAKVVNSDKEPVGPNAQGELYLRGPNVMKGYVNDEEANTLCLDKDGWLRTGDLVSFDDEGRLYVIDRIKELIKYKAQQVAPAELEAVLLTHNSILDAAVVPLPNEEVGEIPVAFVVKSQDSLSEDEVKEFVSGRVAPFKKVRQVVFVDEIPKTMSGKILRKDLARRLLQMSRK